MRTGAMLSGMARLLALVVGFFAVVFLFVGVLWTEWPQTVVGVALALVAWFAWTAGARSGARDARY